MRLPPLSHGLRRATCLALGVVVSLVGASAPAAASGGSSGPDLGHLIEQGRLVEAEVLLQESLEKGHWATVEPHLRRLVRDHPHEPRYLSWLGFCLLKRYDYRGAELAFRAALDLVPDQTAWQVGLARALHQQGRYRGALELLDRAVARDPRPEYRYARASAAWYARRLEVAEAEIRALRRARPWDVEANCWLGRLLMELNRLPEARQPLESCLRDRPDDEDARTMAGLVELHRGNLSEAEEHFRRVLALDPGHLGALYNLAQVLRRRGEMAGARQILRDFEERSRRQDLIEAARDSVRMAPTRIEPRLRLARLLLQDGRLEEAIQAAQAVMRLEPDHQEACDLIEEARRRRDGPLTTPAGSATPSP